MPYGYSRKRRSHRSGVPLAKRTRKNYGFLNKAPGFSKTLISRTGNKPYGYNTGNALHIDRPVNTTRGVVPNRLYTKMRYVDNFTVFADNLTGLTGSDTPYRLNSLFDPYFNAGGHQPLGFDQITPLYQRYKVFKVDVQIATRGRTGTGLGYCAVNVRNAASTYNLAGLKAVAEIQEQPCNTILDGVLVQSWNQTLWMHEIEGRTFEEYMAADAYGALVTTNPALTPYLSVACGTFDTPASTTTGVYITVAFVFHAYFYEANPLGQS